MAPAGVALSKPLGTGGPEDEAEGIMSAWNNAGVAAQLTPIFILASKEKKCDFLLSAEITGNYIECSARLRAFQTRLQRETGSLYDSAVAGIEVDSTHMMFKMLVHGNMVDAIQRFSTGVHEYTRQRQSRLLLLPLL